ncbi:MAG TPA: dihydropyrimidinase, partial [Gemmatimonadaceae bacterium]|nr:dihydropyrimidinase [Gemmatimonadaceae bacterium]
PEKRFELSHANLHMRADYAAYEGKTVIGAPVQVLSRGEVIVDSDKTIGKKGRGQFLRRGTFSL